jgi:AGCS family alanine or glycine:cation symporter
VSDLTTLRFSFTTIIEFAPFGERCSEYLFCNRSNQLFRLGWVGALVAACLSGMPSRSTTNQALNTWVAIPNGLALVLLQATIFKPRMSNVFGPG